jgi:hypothetical protein
MSSVTDPQPDPAADEIVAYLDGELAPQDCRRVESRLATDEKFRQELHELDRAWDALDALPASTVDDGFARTTIELACVAAEADLTENAAAAKAANRHRKWRWIAAGVAAGVFGFLAGRALVPHHNGELLADLPAIHQLNVLPYVENVDFLRRLSAAMAPEQFIKDKETFDHNVKELESANSPSFETRREWIQSLPTERKAELADHTRTYNELESSTGERERMRTIMDEVRQAKDSAELQKTLVAFGQWLSRHSGGQQELLLEQLNDLPADKADKRVEVVRRHIEQDERLASRHLSADDAEKLRQEIIQIAQENKEEMLDRARKARKGARNNSEGSFAPQGSMFALADRFKGDKRMETANRLVGKLSDAAQAHWKSLEGQRKSGQLWIWIQDAMKLKADPEKLEQFFAGEKLLPEERQKLLEEPRANMEADLERMYIRSELGVENAGQLFGDFGEPGRMPWNGRGIGPPREGEGLNRQPGFGPGPRPDGPPGERRPRNRPTRPPGDQPPPDQQKQQSI